MTLRELKDTFKVYFDLEKAKRGATLELSDMAETTLLLQGLIIALSQLGAYAEKSIDYSSSYPSGTQLSSVLLPSDFGMIKRVLYYGESVPEINYSFRIQNGNAYLDFNDDAKYLSDELVVEYYVFGENLFSVIPQDVDNTMLLFSTYSDTFIIPIDNKALLSVIYATLSLIFPDLEAQFMRQVSLVRGTVHKPSKLRLENKDWRL